MAKHFEHQRLGAQVINEWPGHVDGDVLNVEKAERSGFAGVTDWFGRKGFIVMIQKIELTEHVAVLGRNADGV